MVMWAIQRNGMQERESKCIIQALQELGLKYTEVDVPFFAAELPDWGLPEETIFYGSTTLVDLVYRQGSFNPGIFFNEDYRTSVWQKNGVKLFNKDAKVMTMADLAKHWDDVTCTDRVFIKPDDDSKVFCGSVFTKEEYMLWYNNIASETEWCQLRPNHMVVVDRQREVRREIRHFIIDGEIVSSTQYRWWGRLEPQALCPELNRIAIKRAQELADNWLPSGSCIMDTMHDTSSHRDDACVIEYGCINAAGFYKADIKKVIQAMDKEARSII